MRASSRVRAGARLSRPVSAIPVPVVLVPGVSGECLPYVVSTSFRSSSADGKLNFSLSERRRAARRSAEFLAGGGDVGSVAVLGVRAGNRVPARESAADDVCSPSLCPTSPSGAGGRSQRSRVAVVDHAAIRADPTAYWWRRCPVTPRLDTAGRSGWSPRCWSPTARNRCDRCCGRMSPTLPGTAAGVRTRCGVRPGSRVVYG